MQANPIRVAMSFQKDEAPWHFSFWEDRYRTFRFRRWLRKNNSKKKTLRTHRIGR